MLKPTEIIDAQALVIALKQQFKLPAELQLELNTIGDMLQSDPNYINLAIENCVELAATYQPLYESYKTVASDLQASDNNNRMGVSQKPKSTSSQRKFSPEGVNITNDVRKDLLGVLSPKKPLSLWDYVSKITDKMSNKKSRAN